MQVGVGPGLLHAELRAAGHWTRDFRAVLSPPLFVSEQNPLSRHSWHFFDVLVRATTFGQRSHLTISVGTTIGDATITIGDATIGDATNRMSNGEVLKGDAKIEPSVNCRQ